MERTASVLQDDSSLTPTLRSKAERPGVARPGKYFQKSKYLDEAYIMVLLVVVLALCLTGRKRGEESCVNEALTVQHNFQIYFHNRHLLRKPLVCWLI